MSFLMTILLNRNHSSIMYKTKNELSDTQTSPMQSFKFPNF